MPNEQTSVPLYAASEVLTAANMNISAGTGVPVFATTVTRDAAFGGANEKVLAEGQLCYLSATNVVQYYDGAAWATVGPAVAAASGLTLISTTTIGTTVSSVTVSSAFSATYDAYKIIVTGGASSASNTALRLTLGATVTGYAMQLVYGSYANTPLAAGATSQSSWLYTGGSASTTTLAFFCELYNPFLTELTFVQGVSLSTGDAGFAAGFLNDTTSYTAFTITPASGTITGGNVRVYGYQNS